jgi:hypothetical protein
VPVAPSRLGHGKPGRVKYAKVGTARTVPPPHDTSDDAGGDLDAVLAPGGARYRTRTAGVPPLLASHALSSADAEEISTDGLALRLELDRRAPVRATTTPTKKDCDVMRRAAGSRPRLVAVPADNALCARRPQAGSASCVTTRPQARLPALARAPVRRHSNDVARVRRPTYSRARARLSYKCCHRAHHKLHPGAPGARNSEDAEDTLSAAHMPAAWYRARRAGVRACTARRARALGRTRAERCAVVAEGVRRARGAAAARGELT